MQGQNFIDGKWVSGASAKPNINPSNVTDVIGEYAQADRQRTQCVRQVVRRQHPVARRYPRYHRH